MHYNSKNDANATFIESGGNVFADLGLPDADDLFVKADLMHAIAREIRQRDLNASASSRVDGPRPVRHFAYFFGEDGEVFTGASNQCAATHGH